jgi:hypothetical protein
MSKSINQTQPGETGERLQPVINPSAYCFSGTLQIDPSERRVFRTRSHRKPTVNNSKVTRAVLDFYRYGQQPILGGLFAVRPYPTPWQAAQPLLRYIIISRATRGGSLADRQPARHRDLANPYKTSKFEGLTGCTTCRARRTVKIPAFSLCQERNDSSSPPYWAAGLCWTLLTRFQTNSHAFLIEQDKRP